MMHAFHLFGEFSVDSNDSLYGSDPKYVNEVRSVCSTLVEQILNHLQDLKTAEVGYL